MSPLDPKLLTIDELFNVTPSVFTVPIYQRNFAWKAQQIEQLLVDILDAMNDDVNSYFLGNLVVTESQKEPDNFEVIDGQQRLTTLYLLLSCFSNDSSDEKSIPLRHEGCLRYQSRPHATAALQRISSATSTQHVLLNNSLSQEDEGIHQGYRIIRQFILQNMKGDDEKREFLRYLLKRVNVVRVSLPPKTDFNRYFEVMNTRGQQLAQSDIVKARLMQRLDNHAERACFAWIWEACSDMNSYIQMTLTRGRTDLRTRLFGPNWSWLQVENFEELVSVLQESNSKERGPKEPETTRATFDAFRGESLSIDQAIAKYDQVGLPPKDEDADDVKFRSTIDFTSFLLQVLKAKSLDVKDAQEAEGHLDDKRLIKEFEEVFQPTKESETNESPRVQAFAFKLLKCRNLFDSFVLKRQYTATNGEDGDWSLQRLTRQDGKASAGYFLTFPKSERDGKVDADHEYVANELLVLQSMLRVTYTSPRTMHWITRLLSWLLETKPEEVKESDLIDHLRTYAFEEVKRVFPLEGEAQPQGFEINRIVFTYLDYLLWTDTQESDFRFSFRNSIEHFYPQHRDEQQSGDRISPSCLHLLGNLALVTVGANSKFSNSLPKAKAENFKNAIEKQSPKLKMMAKITTAQGKWSDAEIKAHHDAMIQRLRAG
jgi:hypothetical protein